MLEKEFIERFQEWQEKAKAKGNPDVTAMNLSTVSAEGRPSARVVLLKALDDRGFVFYTNLGSRKAQELAQNPHVALCFNWMETQRQVRIEGRVEAVSTEEADAYYKSRDRKSRIGAWASIQSTEIENSLDFEKRLAKYTLKYAVGDIPRPEFWSGFRVIPDRLEFWSAGDFRLHKREVFTFEEGSWSEVRLYP